MDACLNEVIPYLLSQSWQIAVLAVVVAVVTFALRNRSAHVRYLLWMIVLAKCLVPPLHMVPLRVLPQAVPEAMPSVWSPPAENEERPLLSEEAPLGPPGRPQPASAPSPAAAPHRVSRLATVDWLGIAWALGAGAYLLLNLLRALRGHCWIWRTRRPLPAQVQAETRNLLHAYGTRRTPALWMIEGVGQPFVWGLVRGSIYVPPGFLTIESAQQRRDILAHELGHVLRYDAAVNTLQVVAQGLFWFHPLVWWANRKTRQEREKVCDEMAVARLGSRPKEYSTAILNTLIQAQESTRRVPSLAVAGQIKNIEERIKTMLRPGKRFYQRPSLVTATFILLLGLLTVPTSLVLTAVGQTEPASERKPEITRSIYYAASVGDVEQVRLHISNGSDVNEKTTTGDTALHYAARYGREDVAKLLIADGAHVNEKNADGDTPLHYAAKYADTPLPGLAKYAYENVAELLISAGADVSAKNKNGDLPIHLALRGNLESRKAEVLELLVAKSPTLHSIYMAAYQGDLAEVKRVLEQGISVDSRDSEGRTALHYAALHGKLDVVEFLLSQGANVNLKDNSWGFTPLHHACSGGNTDIVKMLIAKEADVSAKDKHGWTPLDSAVYAQKDTVALLIRAGADVNSRYDGGQTPLMWAAQDGHEDVAALLIANGAEIDARDEDGWTPLHHAAWRGNRDVAELLIGKGANVNARDDYGVGPLWRARNTGHKEIAEMLSKHGAKE